MTRFSLESFDIFFINNYSLSFLFFAKKIATTILLFVKLIHFECAPVLFWWNENAFMTFVIISPFLIQKVETNKQTKAKIGESMVNNSKVFQRK